MLLPFSSAEPLLCVRCFTNYTLSCPSAAQGKVVGDLPVDSCPFLLKLPLLKAFLGEEDLSRLFTADVAGQPEVTPGHFSGCSQRGVVLLICKLSNETWDIPSLEMVQLSHVGAYPFFFSSWPLNIGVYSFSFTLDPETFIVFYSPGSLGIKTSPSNVRGVGSIPGWGAKIPHVCDQRKQNKGFPCGSAGKESTCNSGDLGLMPGLERSPGGGHGNPLQYSCLEKPHEQRSLAGYSPWSSKEADMTEQLSLLVLNWLYGLDTEK